MNNNENAHRLRILENRLVLFSALNPFCTKLGSFANVARIVKDQARIVVFIGAVRLHAVL